MLLVVLAHVGAHLNNSHRALPGEVPPVVLHAFIYASLGLLAARGMFHAGAVRLAKARP